MTGDDRLSAHLDGELDPAAAGEVEAQLAADPALAAELEAVREARQLVRSLPLIDPPDDFEMMPAASVPADEVAPVVSLADRRRSRWLLGVAAATIFFVVLGFAAGTPVVDVVPNVDQLVDQHAAASEAMPEPAVVEPFAKMPDDEMPSVGGMAPAMPDMPMVAVYEGKGVMHFLYDSDHGPVSVFREEGRLDGSALVGAELMPLPSGPARYMVDDDTDVVVVQRDDVVYTVIGESANHDMVLRMADTVPEADRSIVERVRRWLGGLR